MPDYFVTPTPANVPLNETNGLAVGDRPVVPPTCTCVIADGSHADARGGVINTPVERIDPKGRTICQVHYPQEKYEYESRALGGLDNYPRTT